MPIPFTVMLPRRADNDRYFAPGETTAMTYFLAASFMIDHAGGFRIVTPAARLRLAKEALAELRAGRYKAGVARYQTILTEAELRTANTKRLQLFDYPVALRRFAAMTAASTEPGISDKLYDMLTRERPAPGVKAPAPVAAPAAPVVRVRERTRPAPASPPPAPAPTIRIRERTRS